MNEVGFGTGNWIALILYLIATLLVGVYFTKRAGQDTDAFFKAKGRVNLCDNFKCDYLYGNTRKSI